MGSIRRQVSCRNAADDEKASFKKQKQWTGEWESDSVSTEEKMQEPTI